MVVAIVLGMLTIVVTLAMLVMSTMIATLALVLVLVLVRVDAGTGRLKSCYSKAQPSRLPLQLCHGNNKAHSSWYFSNHCLAHVLGLKAVLVCLVGSMLVGSKVSSWFVGSTEAIVMHNHRGLTRTINANHGRGNPHVSLIAMKR